MEDTKKIISETLLRVLNQYLENQKKPRNYGLEELLYPAEVHLIMLAGQNPTAGVTELAQKAGVTKGAVSQMMQKLVKKQLIKKSQDPQNSKRVVLKLTNKGKIAYYSHERMHEEIDRELFVYLKKLRPAELKVLRRFLSLVEQGILERSET